MFCLKENHNFNGDILTIDGSNEGVDNNLLSNLESSQLSEARAFITRV